MTKLDHRGLADDTVVVYIRQPHEICPACESLAVTQAGGMIVDTICRRDEKGELWDTEIKDRYGWTSRIDCTCRKCGQEWTTPVAPSIGDIIIGTLSQNCPVYEIMPGGQMRNLHSWDEEPVPDKLAVQFMRNVNLWFVNRDKT